MWRKKKLGQNNSIINRRLTHENLKSILTPQTDLGTTTNWEVNFNTHTEDIKYSLEMII